MNNHKKIKAMYKKQFIQTVFNLFGCSTSYSGKKQTMYITGKGKTKAVREIKAACADIVNFKITVG